MMKNGLAIIKTKNLFLFQVRHPFEVTLFYGTDILHITGRVPIYSHCVTTIGAI